MKLFLVGLGSLRREQIDVARALKEHHEIEYWVRMRKIFAIDEKEFPKTVFHDYLDAIKGFPAPAFANSYFDPWGADAIRSYAVVESEFMSMADKWYPDWSVNRRKELYYNLLRYWDGVLETLAPDCIIQTSVPHEMYTFVLFRLAQARGIRTLIIDDTVFGGDRSVLIDDYMLGNQALKHAAEEGPATLEELSPEMRTHWETISKNDNPLPPLMESFNVAHTPLRNIRRFFRVSFAFLKDGSLLERAVLKLFKLLKPSLVDEYRVYERAADLSKPYLYFPLHYQPELTTSPLGGVFVDQVLAVKTLAAAVPDGWEVYVKEHPAHVGVHGGNATPARYPGIFADIAAIPRVRLVPIATNTFTLQDHARATATITGTAAWESILRGKCALVFGYPWFMDAPGIMRVSSVRECKNAIAKIVSGYAPKTGEILRFLLVLERVSIRAYLQTMKPGREGEWKNMQKAIEDALASPGAIR